MIDSTGIVEFLREVITCHEGGRTILGRRHSSALTGVRRVTCHHRRWDLRGPDSVAGRSWRCSSWFSCRAVAPRSSRPTRARRGNRAPGAAREVARAEQVGLAAGLVAPLDTTPPVARPAAREPRRGTTEARATLGETRPRPRIPSATPVRRGPLANPATARTGSAARPPARDPATRAPTRSPARRRTGRAPWCRRGWPIRPGAAPPGPPPPVATPVTATAKGRVKS